MKNKLSWTLMLAGWFVVAYAITTWAGERWMEKRDRVKWQAALEKNVVADMDGMGILKCKRLDLEVIVRDGTKDSALERGAAWIPGTARPGQGGNVGIAAHRDTFFRPLRNLKIGDEFDLVSTQGTTRYVVEDKTVVKPSNVGVLRPTKDSTLTLITCYPFNFIGPAPNRLAIRAVAKLPAWTQNSGDGASLNEPGLATQY